MGLDLDYLFHPRSIAIVGASAEPGKQGNRYIQALLDLGYAGAIYPVHPRQQGILGLKTYARLLDIPEPVDYVISVIPAAGVVQLVDECATKMVRILQLFTARFSETGHAENAALERDLLQRAKQAGIRILGPNCMGIYCAASGLGFKRMPREAGPVAFVSQSGGHVVELVHATSLRGIRYSKAVSYGNGMDIGESELLDYLAADPETSVIGIYLEGVRDGPRFVDVLGRCAARKPVVLFKGGRSTAGGRAVASHTASMAGSRLVWHGLARQTGAVLVDNIEQMTDMLVAFRFFPEATGTRVGVVGGGGGRTVEAADECEEQGLRLEPIPAGLREEFKRRDPELWDWIGNPADGSILLGSGLTEEGVFGMMARSPAYDMMIGNIAEFWDMEHPRSIPVLKRTVAEFIREGKTGRKPVAIVMSDSVGLEPWQSAILAEVRQDIVAADVAVFPTVRRAARALSRAAAYWRDRQQIAGTARPSQGGL